MHRMWKLKLNLKKKVAGGSFLNTAVNKLPFEMYLPDHNFTGREQHSIKIESGWNAKGMDLTNKYS